MKTATIKPDPNNAGDWICNAPPDDRTPRVWLTFTGPGGIRASVGIRVSSEGVGVEILNNVDNEPLGEAWATWGELDVREEGEDE